MRGSARPKGVWIDWRWIVVALLVVIVGSNGYWVWKTAEQMRVMRVIDGDTFVVKTGERVRLVGLDAPETGSCGAEEAKVYLEGLISGKLIRLAGDDRDSWGRRLGFVTAGNTDVNLEMVRSGWARYDSFADIKSPELAAVGQQVEENGLGVYGPVCDQQESCGI